MIRLTIFQAISRESAVFPEAVGQNMIIARGRLVVSHIQWVKFFIISSFILQYKYFYVLYTDINFEIMAKNSLDGWVFSFAAKLFGKWLNAAVKPAIKPN